MIAAPLLVAGASMASRRYGSAVGGWLVGLPLTSGPISIFFTLEQGKEYSAQAALRTLVGMVAMISFGVAFTLASTQTKPRQGHWRWLSPFCIALASYGAVILTLSLIPFNLVSTLILLLLTLFTALRVVGIPKSIESARPVPRWDLPFRMAAATIMVVAISSGASALGHKWGGMLSQFPIFSCVMAALAQYHGDHDGVRRLFRGVITSSFGCAAFFIILSLFLRNSNPITIYGLAALAAFGLNGLLLFTFLNPKRLDK